MTSSTSRSTWRRAIGRFLAIPTLLFIAFSTLVPSGDDFAEEWTFWCLFCGDQPLSDALANTLLFVPLGLGLGLLGWRTLRVWACATGLSVVIELVQFLIPGRWPAIGDMVFNGLGAALGCFLVASAATWLRPPEKRAPWLSLIAGLAAGVLFVATAFLLAPWFPRSTYWGQWTPRLEGLEVYEGRVLDASVSALPLPPHRLSNSDSVVALLLNGAPLTVTAIAGPNPPDLASLVSIADTANRQILLVGPDADDLMFFHRTRADELGLSHPPMELDGWLLGVRPGDTLRVTARRQGESFCVTLNGRTECEGFTVGEGWSILHETWGVPWLPLQAVSALWLAGLLIPFGLWARRHPASVAGGLIAVAALVLTPPLTGVLLATPVYQWVAMLVGIVVGIVIARRLASAGQGVGSGE